MIKRQHILAGFAVLALGINTAQAGPCNTVGSVANRDAGSGPTPGNTGQTMTSDSANASQHPPTSTMDRATAGVAASAEDAQKQMQGQPTDGQRAQGARSTGPTTDQDC
jgi:hypothetical protein